jgi:hypothetical protein
MRVVANIASPFINSRTDDMATRRSNSKSSTARSESKNVASAIALLTADHDKVKKLFREFSRMHQREQSEGAEQLAR